MCIFNWLCEINKAAYCWFKKIKNIIIVIVIIIIVIVIVIVINIIFIIIIIKWITPASTGSSKLCLNHSPQLRDTTPYVRDGLFPVWPTNGKFIFYIDKLYNASSLVLCQVSMFTSSAISVDRLLALLSGLRYRQVVTLPRVHAVIICFWLISTTCGLMYFWNVNTAFTVSFALKITFLATSVLSYLTIYLNLRQHQLQVWAILQGKPNGRQVPLNIARYKKSVSSALRVQLSLVTCYIPYIVVQIMDVFYTEISRSKFEIACYATATLIYLNSSINPILYCWRIGAIRQAAKDTIKQLNCCCKSD